MRTGLAFISKSCAMIRQIGIYVDPISSQFQCYTSNPIFDVCCSKFVINSQVTINADGLDVYIQKLCNDNQNR